MKQNSFGTKISAGFFNTVYRSNEGNTVIKVPKQTARITNQTIANIRKALRAHEEFLGERLPETQVTASDESPLGYVFEQDYIPGKKLTTRDLKNHPQIAQDMIAMLDAGDQMQHHTKIYFDPYSMSDYLCNTYKMIVNKPLLFGNMLVDENKKLHYIDVGYIRTDRLGAVHNALSQAMHRIIGIR